jgi:2,3-bisphosphoglycerate-independent phosphoglycerate mutase
MLVILDGWGWREDTADNAVQQARTPTFDRIWAECPHNFLRTSGRDVGLPDGQMGNSEVGHLNIGAGRVVMQALPRIATAIEDGSLGQAPAMTGLIENLRATGGVCHLIGLVSPGGVHSHQDHAVALACWCTPLSMDATHHRVLLLAIWSNFVEHSRAGPLSPRSAVAIMPWIVTTGGNVWPKPGTRWSRPRGLILPILRQ